MKPGGAIPIRHHHLRLIPLSSSAAGTPTRPRPRVPPSPLDQRSVGILLNGLDHLSLWRGRTVVIKYGGSAMGYAELRASLPGTWRAWAPPASTPSSSTAAGPQIDALMRRLGKTPRFVDGLRVTDEATMEVVEMV